MLRAQRTTGYRNGGGQKPPKSYKVHAFLARINEAPRRLRTQIHNSAVQNRLGVKGKDERWLSRWSYALIKSQHLSFFRPEIRKLFHRSSSTHRAQSAPSQGPKIPIKTAVKMRVAKEAGGRL